MVTLNAACSGMPLRASPQLCREALMVALPDATARKRRLVVPGAPGPGRVTAVVCSP